MPSIDRTAGKYNSFAQKEAAALTEQEYGYTIERAIYDSVADLKITLNETELEMIANQLAIAFQRYETLALSLHEVRQELYRQYTEAVIERRAVSHFSRDFNMSLKGHNEMLSGHIVTSFKLAFEADSDGNGTVAATQLQMARLRHSTLFDSEVLKIVEAGSSQAKSELIRIRQHHRSLFRSVLPLAAKVARTHARDLSGMTVDFPDLLQEAFLAALQVVENYKPIDGGKTLTSFIYRSVKGIVARRKQEMTRNVVLPRTLIDRSNYLYAAARDMGIYREVKEHLDDVTGDEIEEITTRANEKLPNGGSKFTSTEAKDLLASTQEEASMDMVVATDSEGYITTIGDQIKDETNLDVGLDMKYAGRRLMELIRPYVSVEEYTLLELRWGMGGVQSYHRAAVLYSDGTGKPMNKTSASNIEQRVFKRLRALAASDSDLMARFMQIWDSIDGLEEM